jgi:hypothetical protein
MPAAQHRREGDAAAASTATDAAGHGVRAEGTVQACPLDVSIVQLRIMEWQ